MKVMYIHNKTTQNIQARETERSREIHESLVVFGSWIWIDNLMWTGQLPTEEQFNHLLAMVQQAMSATGVRLKVAPLAIESLQPKKGVTMCRGFTQWLQHIYPNLPNCWAQREVTSLSSHPKRTFLFQRNFIHWTSDQIMCCGVAGHQRKLQS